MCGVYFRSVNGLGLSLGSDDVQVSNNVEHRSCQVGRNGLSFHKLDAKRPTVEPRTGIEFPVSLKKNASGLTSEVLVATGSRTMKIVKIKSLKVYAFGFCKLHSSSFGILFSFLAILMKHSLPFRCSSFVGVPEAWSKVCFYSREQTRQMWWLIQRSFKVFTSFEIQSVFSWCSFLVSGLIFFFSFFSGRILLWVWGLLLTTMVWRSILWESKWKVLTLFIFIIDFQFYFNLFTSHLMIWII